MRDRRAYKSPVRVCWRERGRERKKEGRKNERARGGQEGKVR
jgi:hypothetical protein